MQYSLIINADHELSNTRCYNHVNKRRCAKPCIIPEIPQNIPCETVLQPPQDERHRRDDHVEAWLLRGRGHLHISMAPVMGIHLDHQDFDSIGFVSVGSPLADLVIW